MFTVTYESNCHNTNEYGDSCDKAYVDVSTGLIDRIKALQSLIKAHSLDSVTQYADNVEWGNPEFEKEYRLEGTKLVVTRHCFWFTDTIKHCDGELQTEMFSVEQIEKFISEKQSAG